MELTGVWGTGSGIVIASGWRYNEAMSRYEGVILRNGGSGWTETVSASGTNRRFQSLHGDGAGNVWIVGSATSEAAESSQDALVMHSADNGASWTEARIPLPGYNPQLFDVWASGPNDVHAVGAAHSYTTAKGHALRLRFDGLRWTSVVADSVSSLATVWGTGGRIFAAGHTRESFSPDRQGLILSSTDGGLSFQETVVAPTVGAYRMFRAAWGASPESMYLVGTGGGILHFDGARWEETGVGERATLAAMWGFSARNVYALGNAGAVLHGTR